MMKAFYTILCWSMILVTTTSAQQNQYLGNDQSDPEAVALLDRMEMFLNAHATIKVQFETQMMTPGESPMHYAGTFEQKDFQYKIDVGEFQIYSDGVTRWVYLKEANEVNIYNADPEDGPQTPLDHLQLYKNEQFVFAITGQELVREQKAQLVELKPLDKHSDFSKVRLAIRTKDAAPLSAELFEKGGSRIVLDILNIEKAGSFPDGYFVFPFKSYPGVRVEDLRID